MKKRLFIAIELPDKLKTELGYIVDQLSTLRGLTPVKKNQLHITLAFLGDTETDRIPGLKKTMDKLARLTHPIEIIPSSPVPFLDWAHLRGVWVPVKNTMELSNLAHILRANLLNSGLRPDLKLFDAHITLVRIQSHVDIDKLQALLKDLAKPPLPKGTADTITLYSSQATPHGHIHTIEHQKRLTDNK